MLRQKGKRQPKAINNALAVGRAITVAKGMLIPEIPIALPKPSFENLSDYERRCRYHESSTYAQRAL